MQVPRRTISGDSLGDLSLPASPEAKLNSPTHRAASAKVVAQPTAKPHVRFEALGFPLLLGVIISTLIVGWLNRERLGFEAESGVGYWLGVAGLSCVGVLLVYPLRKRIRFLGFIGSVPGWFHLHMTLGLIAPTLILFHAGFQTGSINALVALTSMLVVAGSGILGRMLYVRIHRGLAGKRAEVRAMAADAGALRETMVQDFAEVADISDELEATLHKPRANVFTALAYSLAASARIAQARQRMLTALKRGATTIAIRGAAGQDATRRLRRDGAVLIKAYCRALRREANLTFFERLFALWHIMHLPLFFLMVVAAAIHVVAVHLY